MALPRVTLPLLLIDPPVEEERFWALQHDYLARLDLLCGVMTLVGGSVLLYTHVPILYHVVPPLAPWLTGTSIAMMSLGVVQVVIPCAAPDWWRRHRRLVCIMLRALHSAVLVVLISRINAAPMPLGVALSRVCRDMFKFACGSDGPLSILVTMKMLMTVSWVSALVLEPFLFPLPFTLAAVMSLTTASLVSWLAWGPPSMWQAVDARLVSHSRELCMLLGRLAAVLGEVFWGAIPQLHEQCDHGGVTLPQRFLLFLFGVVAPLLAVWLAEYHLKILYVTQRTKQLLGPYLRAGGAHAAAAAVHRPLAAWSLSWRVVAVLGLVYAVVWHVLALLPG